MQLWKIVLVASKINIKYMKSKEMYYIEMRRR